MGIMDFKSSVGVGSDSYLHLRVKKDVDVIPDMEIAVTSLNNLNNNRFNHFFSNGYGGITFKIEVLLKATDLWNNESVISVFRLWYQNMTPLAVVTDAVDVPDGQYIISANPSRKQNYKGSTVWELEFTTYNPLVLAKFKNDNTNILNALKKNKAKQNASTNKKNALSKCKYNVLKYSKKKKVVKCVKTLQTVLKKKKYYTGKVDGWFGKSTTAAVKKFQKTYNQKKNRSYALLSAKNKALWKAKGKTIKKLPTNGKVDKATYNQLIKL